MYGEGTGGSHKSAFLDFSMFYTSLTSAADHCPGNLLVGMTSILKYDGGKGTCLNFALKGIATTQGVPS